MKEFASRYGFNHVTSSPHYLQSNAFAEQMVKTVKKLLSGTCDMYLVILSYRTTSLPWCNLTPAELLMERWLKTDVPLTKELLIPSWPHLTDFAEKDRRYKEKQKKTLTDVTMLDNHFPHSLMIQKFGSILKETEYLDK